MNFGFICCIIRNSSGFPYFLPCLGIVLKKARMSKKGTGNSNVGKEGSVDTLVIRSGDLVQVVAKVNHSYNAMQCSFL